MVRVRTPSGPPECATGLVWEGDPGVKMVVKSATKKRLMELGVSEEYAHKLATDRNMTDIKNMSHDDVASTLGISKDAEEFINTMQIIAEQGSRRRAAKKSTKITIRAKAVDDMDRPEITSRFNALNHELVPHQNSLVKPTSPPRNNSLWKWRRLLHGR